MNPVCKEIREDILRISKESRHGHIPSCFSIIEILYSIYDIMKHDPGNPDWEERDIFVLSKGHAALTHYCVLAKLGYFTIDEVYSFGSFMSDFGCHADRHKVAGVEVATGSLGHGIGVAVGMALALKLKKTDRQVFVVIGDGESNEGSVWEAIMVAVNLRLNNLHIVYDNNRSHARGLQIDNPVAHFAGFGCDTSEVDGHSVDELKEKIIEVGNTVRVIVANTKKGFGCRTLVENHYEWHRKSPSDEEFEKLMAELDEKTI